MLTDNLRISDRQLMKMLVLDMSSISILIIPYIAAAGAGKDGLFSIITAAVGALFYGLLMLYFYTRCKQDYLQYCKHVLGKSLTFLFGLLYLVKFVFAAVFVLTLFTNVIQKTILPNTSHRLILGSLILVSVYYAAKTMDVRARIAEILYFIVLIPLILLFLLGLYKVNPANLLPLATNSLQPVLKSGYSVFLTYWALEFILFAAPSLSGNSKNSNFRQKVMQAIVITSMFHVLVFIIVTGLLGISGATGKLWSAISVMQMIEIPGGFVHRQDALMLSFWLVSIFTVTSLLFHYLCQITKAITGVKKQGYILLFYAGALFAAAMRPINLDALFYYFNKYMAYVGFPQSIILPLLLIIVGKIRKGDRK